VTPSDTHTTEDRIAELERRLIELEDERAIRYLLSRYAYVSDFGNSDDLVKLYTEDGAIDMAMGESFGKYAVTDRWEGRDQLHAYMNDPRWDKTWYTNVMHMQHNNLEITISGDQAIATAYAFTLDARTSPFTVSGGSNNRWTLRKVDGQWLISERRLRAARHPDFAAMVLGDGQKPSVRG
jgi:hypothetical protein